MPRDIPLPHEARLVGFGGWAECGKDSVVDVLHDELNWRRTFMSKPLEAALLALDPIVGTRNAVGTHDLLPGPDSTFQREFTRIRYSELHAQVGYTASKRSPEVRRLLQALGTEVGRNILGPDVWVDAIFDREIDPVLRLSDRKIAVTGMRFPNELAAVRERGGLLLWVRRPGYEPLDGHASENSVGPEHFDGVINNDGTLDDLRVSVLKAFRRAS